MTAQTQGSMSTSQPPKILEQQRKLFTKLFNLLVYYINHDEGQMRVQGLSALASVSGSHYSLFLQEEPQLLKLLELCEPPVPDEADTDKLDTKVKIVEQMTDMCR